VTSRNLFTSRAVAVSRADLNRKIQEVLAGLRTEGNVDAQLRELYTLLISPVAGLVEPGQTLVIIPDGALHGLPFGAIRHPGSRDYLVERYPLIMSPSLTHLLAAGSGQPPRGALVSTGAQTDDVSSFRELAALQKYYSSVEEVAGGDVDKQRFLEALDGASVFHYAGHSAYDAADPLGSSILLDGKRGGPNSVTAVDIARQRLGPNALVVLSSCDSSVGNSRDGVGMRGLTSAFLIGGAGAVVGSLWPVEASSTLDLMVSFHSAYATSKTPAAHALRLAQLSFLRSAPGSHPYYWAGFVVTGNLSSLR
jgi:CHAT domain-containing protein